MYANLRLAAIAALIFYATAAPIIPAIPDKIVETSRQQFQHLAGGGLPEIQAPSLDSEIRNISLGQEERATPYLHLAKRKEIVYDEDTIRLMEIRRRFDQHNVTEAQLLTATTPRQGQWLKLTDAQIDAIIAANEAPVKSGEDYRVPYDYIETDQKYKIGNYERERKHLDQINRVLLANLSLPEIHDLFHYESRPVTLADEEVDAALSSHYGQTEGNTLMFCDDDFVCTEGSFRYGQLRGQLISHNLTEGRIAAAIMPKFQGGLINLSNAQVDAIAAADEAPVRPGEYAGFNSTHVIADYPKERKHLDQINRVLLANLTLPEIRDLFHSKDGQPIILTDEEVDTALSAHYTQEMKDLHPLQRVESQY